MKNNKKNAAPAPGELDQLIHERLRLGIVCALVDHESLAFTELRDLLQTTDGNLSVQARKLEEAGYVACSKKFEDRKPRTTYKLTAKGKHALEDYLEVLAEMIPPLPQARAAHSRRASFRPVPSES